MHQAEDRISGLDNQVQDLDQVNKQYERFQKTHERNIQKKIKRPNHQIKGIHEAGESQANGIDQIFNKILEKKLSNFG